MADPYTTLSMILLLSLLLLFVAKSQLMPLLAAKLNCLGSVYCRGCLPAVFSFVKCK